MKCNSFFFIFFSRPADGRSVRCCAEDGSGALPPEFSHYSCLPIAIEPHDEFYDQFRQGCINVVRSALSPDGECRLGYGKQVYTSRWFIDSILYSKISFIFVAEQSDAFH